MNEAHAILVKKNICFHQQEWTRKMKQSDENEKNQGPSNRRLCSGHFG